jgi:TPR repeat protein
MGIPFLVLFPLLPPETTIKNSELLSEDYKEAVKIYRLSAEQGEAEGQSSLAMMYLEGLGVTQDYIEATRLFHLAAEQEEAFAQYQLGLIYAKGVGVLQDEKEAIKWFRRSTLQGFIPSLKELDKLLKNKEQGKVANENKNKCLASDCNKKGWDAYKAKDYKEAVKWYRLSAEQGYADGQFSLGAMYKNGQGVPQDYKEAVKWWKLSAEQGDADAQLNLGRMYREGKGVPQDNKEAVKWWKLSATQGKTRAQTRLGFMYDTGEGVPQDYKEAVKWYRLAAERGSANAQYNLGVMYNNGQGVSQDYALAHMWWNICSPSKIMEECMDSRIEVEKEMNPRQIKQAKEMARKWEPKMALNWMPMKR